MSPRHSRLMRRGCIAACAWLLAAVSLAVLPAQGAEPATVTVRVAEQSGGALQVTAVVADAKGAPLAGAPVVIKVRVAFGWLSIARASTDQAGRARVDLPATLRSGEVSAEAGDDGQVRATVRFGEGTLRQPAVRPGRDALSALSPQPGFISPYPVPLQVALLGLILGGIWTTYGYVVWLLSRIRGAGEGSFR